MLTGEGRDSGVKSFLLLFFKKEVLALPYLTTTADDFGLTPGVNEAVIQAHTNGILTSTSLMVSAPFAADAVAKAYAHPSLAVGLHLVVIEGAPTLAPDDIRDLVDANGRFPSSQLRLGVDYFFRPRVRRQLAAEIRAQFEAFRATGLVLDHANAHKHMHLHPTVGRMMIEIGREFGLRALRVPAERPMPGGPLQGFGDRALHRWTAVLRAQARRAGMLCNDQIIGLGWTGHMTLPRIQHALANLPPGLTEMYFHPATMRDETLRRLMPEYEHEAELQALLSTRLPHHVQLTTFGQQSQGLSVNR